MITRLILIPKGYTSTSKNGCGGPNLELVVGVGWGGVITDEEKTKEKITIDLHLSVLPLFNQFYNF